MIPKALHIPGGLAASCNSEVHLLLLRLGMDGTSNRRSLRRICLGNPPVVAPSDPVSSSHAAAERTRLTVIGVHG